MNLNINLTDLKQIHSGTKKLHGRQSELAFILMESAPNKVTAKIIHVDMALVYEGKLKGNSKGKGTFVLPFTALDEIAKLKGKVKVSFTGNGGKDVDVRVENGSLTRQYKIEAPEVKDFPKITVPDVYFIDADTFTSHLRDAASCIVKDQILYTLTNIELDGSKNRVAATDRKQLFVGNSLKFPFKDKRYLAVDNVFKYVLQKDGDTAIGANDKCVAISIGNWTLIQPGGSVSFPNYDDVLPSKSSLKTHLTLDNDGAKTIMDSIDFLPGNNTDNKVVRLDLNGHLNISGRDKESGETASTDIDATIEGESKVVYVNRAYLKNGLRMGFRNFSISSESKSILATRDDAKYLFMPMNISSEDEWTVDTKTCSINKTETKPGQPRAGKKNRKEKEAMDKEATTKTETGNEITLKALTDQVSMAKDALRMALAGINDLGYKVRDYVRQEKKKEKQGAAAMKALEAFKKIAA